MKWINQTDVRLARRNNSFYGQTIAERLHTSLNLSHHLKKPGTTTRTANRYYKNPEAIKRERAANNNKNYCKNLLRKTENRWVD
ncbi:hypothetical protein [Cellvibrio mixtus]|uniref:hypothetical protein n=1 Tax=Cellvibrio mixtus TaxID=39650 RepID=UPI00114067A1|nr:hypothetical protein [Cellvibrio mixtus]